MTEIPEPVPCPRLQLDFTDEGATFNGRYIAGPVRIGLRFPPSTARLLVEHAAEAYGQDFVADINGLGPETRSALEALVGREVERLERETQRLLTGDDDRLAVVANAIAISVYGGDGRPVPNDLGVDQIEVSAAEAELCRAAAGRVLAHLEAHGHG